MGPVEYVIIEFPGNRFNGQIVPALRELVQAGTIRILDLAFLKKDADGAVSAIELGQLEDDEAADFNDLEFEISGLLNEEDLQIAAEGLADNSSAGLLVWENIWAERVKRAVVDSGGRLAAYDRIPAPLVEAAVAAGEVRG